MKKDNNHFGEEMAKLLPLIMREYARSQHANIFSKISLTVPQILILEYLSEKRNCRMKDLAKTLNLTMSAVTAIVDKMIAFKLVRRERSDEDRRVVNVIMLERGREMLRKVSEAKCKCANELLAPLNQEDKKIYLKILKKVYSGLRQRQ